MRSLRKIYRLPLGNVAYWKQPGTNSRITREDRRKSNRYNRAKRNTVTASPVGNGLCAVPERHGGRSLACANPLVNARAWELRSRA